jgi:hypothetical protein
MNRIAQNTSTTKAARIISTGHTDPRDMVDKAHWILDIEERCTNLPCAVCSVVFVSGVAMDVLTVVGVLVGWIVLQVWVLPRFGVST